MRFTSYRDRSEREVEQKAFELNIPVDQIQQYVQRLKDENFVNNERFSEQYVRGKVRIKRWGRFKLREGLKQAGIPDVLIQKSLEGIPNQLYQENLHFLMRKQQDKYMGLAPNKAKEKIYRFLLSKGYEHELVYAAISELIQ